MESDNIEQKLPNPWLSATPLIVLVAILSVVLTLFGSDALTGGSQVSLLIASGVCVCLSMAVYKTPWKLFEDKIQDTIRSSSLSIVILIVIGMLSGSWMISGIVPTLIYYGIQIMSPQFFLISTCVICAMVSLITGSSWTTIATIGIALIGIGDALGVPKPITAGAIISGAYFGDKISPLSDTTILASSCAGVDLFKHIRYMFYTTTPSLIIALCVFLVAGFWYNGSDAHIDEYTEGLSRTFNLTPWVLIVPLITGILIFKKVPSLITLSVSSLCAGICAILFQRDILLDVAGADTFSALNIAKGLIITYSQSTSVDTGSEMLNQLVSTGGMAGMMNTIWLVLCAMCFGGCMVASNMLLSITSVLIKGVHSVLGLVSSTVLTGITLNLCTGDQYISIVISGSMYQEAYRKAGLAPEVLSRSTEDSATVTSVLIPWNTCGMTQATILGVPTLTYLPFCIFNIVSPFMSCIIAGLNYKIRRIK